MNTKEQEEWDKQIAQDSAAGKLDGLFEEADAVGPLLDWPSQEYPPFVTVLRDQSKQYYAAVMEWDRYQETYRLSPHQGTGTHTDKDTAMREASQTASRLGLEMREN